MTFLHFVGTGNRVEFEQIFTRMAAALGQRRGEHQRPRNKERKAHRMLGKKEQRHCEQLPSTNMLALCKTRDNLTSLFLGCHYGGGGGNFSKVKW
jgi:hypothetical protein